MKKHLSIGASIVVGATFMIAMVPAMAGRADVEVNIGVPGVYQPRVYQQPAPVYLQPHQVYVQPEPVYVKTRPAYIEHGYDWREREMRAHQWRERQWHDRHEHEGRNDEHRGYERGEHRGHND